MRGDDVCCIVFVSSLVFVDVLSDVPIQLRVIFSRRVRCTLSPVCTELPDLNADVGCHLGLRLTS